MENLIELKNTIGSVKSYQITGNKTVKELLEQLKLQNKFFAILINGKNAKLDDLIESGAEITILPKIAGG